MAEKRKNPFNDIGGEVCTEFLREQFRYLLRCYIEVFPSEEKQAAFRKAKKNVLRTLDEVKNG